MTCSWLYPPDEWVTQVNISPIAELSIRGTYFLEEYTDEFNDGRLAAIVGKQQEVVFYSSKSEDDKYLTRATARAVSWGYEKVYFFPDSLDKWKAAEYPLEMGKK